MANSLGTQKLKWMNGVRHRLTLLLTLTVSVAMATDQTPLSRKISVVFNKSSLVECLDIIEGEAGITFFYDAGEIKKITTSYDVTIKNKTVYDVLSYLLRDSGFGFEAVDEKKVVIRKAKAKTGGEAPKKTGVLKGRIVEFETSEPLPGANVVLAGTSLGSTSNVDGYYRFDDLAAGVYTIRVTFIGYEPYTESVDVKAGHETTLDIKLRGTSSALNEIVVQGRRSFSSAPIAHTSDHELIREIRESRSVVSGISNEMIVKMADRNAAEVVKRISGVTVVDDKFIVVRGMNQRYNITYMNENLAPGTETYSRSFAYDLLPSSIIDRILVYKSPSAELQGDFAGGAIKVYTKDAKTVRHLDVGVQLGYRGGTTFHQMNASKGGKYDWLGFDDGSRELPNIPSYEQTGGRNPMSQHDMVSAFSSNWQYGKINTLPDMQLFVNYFDGWSVGNWRLNSLTSLTYTKESRRFVMDRQLGNTFAHMLDPYSTYGEVGASNELAKDDQSTQIAKVNLLQNFTLMLDSANRLEFRNFILNDGRNTTSIRITRPNVYPDLFSGALFRNDERKQNLFRFQQRFLYNGNLGGYHTLRAVPHQQLRWNVGYSYTRQDIPDQRIASFRRYYDATSANTEYYETEEEALRWQADYGGSVSQLFYGLMSRIFVFNTENMYNGSVDYTIKPLNELTIKAGSSHVYSTREVSRRFFKVHRGGLTGAEATFEFTPGALDDAGTIDPNLLRFKEQDLAWIWDPANFPENGKGLGLYDMSNPTDSYTASEQNNSGYVQAEWTPLGKNMTLNAGLRFEHNEQKVAAATQRGGLFIPLGVNLQKNSFLPSVNVTYTPLQTVVFRAGYGKTLNRPEFREISPFRDIDFVNREQIFGNPQLESTVIDNYDIRVELYPRRNSNETFSVGAFYKTLQKPIERLRFDNGNGYFYATSISFFNPDEAKVYGVEFEMRKSLSFVPGNVFRNLSAVVNGTLVKSEVTNVSNAENPGAYNGGAGINVGTFSGRPLQGQAPYVFNAGLFYENPGWGTKVGIIYNVNGPNIYAIANANAEEILAIKAQTDWTPTDDVILDTRPDLLELSRNLLDVSFTQRLYRTLQLRINIQNLLDSPYRLVEDQNYNHKYDREVKKETSASRYVGKGYYYYEGDNNYLTYRTGRYCSVTLTYSF